jgi:hypothetical protein
VRLELDELIELKAVEVIEECQLRLVLRQRCSPLS